MKATDGITTVIDNTHYNKCPDYGQEHFESTYHEPVVLNWEDYFDQEADEIIESIRMYEQFGIYQ
jgi:hypothetical protein